MQLTIGRHWGTNLEPGTWYEVITADGRRVIKGFVFVDGKGVPEYRDVDGRRLSKHKQEHVAHAAALAHALASWAKQEKVTL